MGKSSSQNRKSSICSNSDKGEGAKTQRRAPAPPAQAFLQSLGQPSGVRAAEAAVEGGASSGGLRSGREPESVWVLQIKLVLAS